MKSTFFLVLLFSFVAASPLSLNKRDEVPYCSAATSCKVIECGGSSCNSGICNSNGFCDGTKCDALPSVPFGCVFGCGGGPCGFTCQNCIKDGFGGFKCLGECAQIILQKLQT
ncbi:hypothetical protein RCL_jg13256.t1 [Rhizophagus clarus]|nr:hypothetical protein RCL_jg13256.t1 [Rhizophagus clarus]